jgi:8-oxo-dGTP diphosphatase
VLSVGWCYFSGTQAYTGASWFAKAKKLATVSCVVVSSGVRYVWRAEPVPAHLVVTQVYGFLFCPDTSRVLLQEDDGAFNLPGGTPEPADGGLTGTLAREVAEESQVRFDDAVYLGFQEVHRPGLAPYAQVRMAGRIAGFDPRAPDPDGGRVYRRLLCPLRDAPGLLGWGAPVVVQAHAAGQSALARWGLDAGFCPGPAYVD